MHGISNLGGDLLWMTNYREQPTLQRQYRFNALLGLIAAQEPYSSEFAAQCVPFQDEISVPLIIISDFLITTRTSHAPI
jgi:hypothetical protein